MPSWFMVSDAVPDAGTGVKPTTVSPGYDTTPPEVTRVPDTHWLCALPKYSVVASIFPHSVPLARTLLLRHFNDRTIVLVRASGRTSLTRSGPGVPLCPLHRRRPRPEGGLGVMTSQDGRCVEGVNLRVHRERNAKLGRLTTAPPRISSERLRRRWID